MSTTLLEPSRPKPAITVTDIRGGVSPGIGRPAIHGHSEIARPALGPATAAFPNFSYHGGPVVKCPLVYTSFWGSAWTTDPGHLTRAGRLAQYHQDLVGSNFMNVLNQYGVGKGIYLNTSFFANVPTDLNGAAIQSTLQAAIDSGAIPEPSGNQCIMVYLQEGMSVHDGNIVMCAATSDDAFGFHSWFNTRAGHPLYFAIIPSLNDACVKSSCPGGDNGCSLKLTETQEQRQTQVASHEFAEMTTDPQLNAWYDPTNGENGDLCNGEAATITVGANTWTVQRTYSKTDDTGAPGATFCRADAPQPIPKLPNGPASRPGADMLAERVLPHERVLPMPPVYFDLASRKVSRDPVELKRYVSRAFSPLPHGHLVSDLGGFLREVADAISAGA
jgi:hypothetical protein